MKQFTTVLPRSINLSKVVPSLPSSFKGKRKFKGASTRRGYGPAAYSFNTAFAPSALDTAGGGSLNWSGINANGVNIGSNTETGPAGPATEAILLDKFIPFLESLETEQNSQLIKTIKTGFDACFESEKWAQKAKPKKGKMHKMLGIPEDKEIQDVYTSGKKLAKDLLNACNGDKKKATGMLALPANANSEKNVFDAALSAMKNL